MMMSRSCSGRSRAAAGVRELRSPASPPPVGMRSASRFVRISSVLSQTLLADLPGLTLIAFDPASIAFIIILVMASAFLAGTLPAARAAKADPVESFRYE